MNSSQQMLSVSDHNRSFISMTYVYPVVSRRAGGVSVGINLNPNNACNWHCAYCQVPDLVRGAAPEIDLEQVEDPDLREILFGATRCGFEQFRQQVLEALDHLKPPPPPAPAGDGMTICLAAGEKDQALCDEVGALLVERGWDVVSPSPVPESGENPQTFRETVDEIIRNSDAVDPCHFRSCLINPWN